MLIESLQTECIPQAFGTRSAAVKMGDFIFISGQLPLNPDTGRMTAGGIREQTEQCIRNLENVLKEMELDLSYVLQVRIYMTDLNEMAEMDRVYGEMFRDPCPARTCVGVNALQSGAKIEIEAYAIDTRALEVLCAGETCGDGSCRIGE